LILEFKVKVKCKKGIFGVDPLTLKCIKENDVNIPSILVDMRACIRRHDGFKKEGIFRLSGDISVIQNLRRQIDEYKQFADTKDVYSMANLIKIFYRLLPNPVLQTVPREILMDDDLDDVMEVIAAIPEPQQSLLKWLIGVIHECEVHRALNKMTVENLAIVIAPNLYQVGQEVSPVEALFISQKSARFFGAAIRAMDTGQPEISADIKILPRGYSKMNLSQRRRSKSVNVLISQTRPTISTKQQVSEKPPIPEKPKPSVIPKPTVATKVAQPVKRTIIPPHLNSNDKRGSYG